MNGNSRNGNSRGIAIFITAIMIALIAVFNVSGATMSAEREAAPIDEQMGAEYVQLQQMQDLNKELAIAVRYDPDNRRAFRAREVRRTGVNGGVSYTYSSASSALPYPQVTEYYRVAGYVADDIGKYVIKIQVGPEEHDSETIIAYVKETNPWRAETSENLIILSGQSLTEGFYEAMAIEFARKGYCAFIFNRREANVGMNETDFSDMKDWTIDTYLSDTRYGVIVSRIHTGSVLNQKNIVNVNVSAVGHSAGAIILVKYEASDYDDWLLSSVGKIVPIDGIVKYDPVYKDLIQAQNDRFYDVKAKIDNGTYHNDDMAGMMYVAGLAFESPNNESPIYPGLTNIKLFRRMVSQTHLFEEYPLTPDYHYWTGDDVNGLYYVDEQKILLATLTGGAVPYSPLVMDQYFAGLMGNVEGYDINSTKVDSPVLYVGLGGGCSHYGAWWFIEEVGKTNDNIMTFNWRHGGHGSAAMDKRLPELCNIIDFWLRLP